MATRHLSIVFAIVLFICSPVSSVKKCESSCGKICDFKDDECVRWGSNNFYVTMAAGVPGVVESSDPLHLDEITGEIECFKYKLTNLNLTGLASCTIINSHISTQGLTYQQFVVCPKLVIDANYEAKGQLGPANIDGEGIAKLTAFDYGIIFIGKYGRFVCKRDGKVHFNIMRNRVVTDPRGEVMLEAKRLDGKEASQEALDYINSNWDIFDQYAEDPILSAFAAELIKNHLSKYLATLRLDQVFPAEKCDRL